MKPEPPTPIGYVFAFFAAAGAVMALVFWIFGGGTDRLYMAGLSAVMAFIFYLGGRSGFMQ
ncbi:hypothetical protein MKK55_28665 [Methylobacterium sp. J-059]|uniref:hypothetical protein n=1 Tax=Methylobacterium sp. J-059 TaxID=2836643 RepID=UPI001FBA089B|nr:hypothetical protein [Methylobacterium sp. J-059]MCJ2042890.1 hypothetical protein [Methylobacterium sp. J-059]